MGGAEAEAVYASPNVKGQADEAQRGDEVNLQNYFSMSAGKANPHN
jgi:hypothetical protein